MPGLRLLDSRFEGVPPRSHAAVFGKGKHGGIKHTNHNHQGVREILKLDTGVIKTLRKNTA